MHEPDYTDYSINELRDCLVHIDQEKYPERHQSLTHELYLRQQAGETPTDPLINEFTARDVPPGLALRCFWCFLWRYSLAIAISQVLVKGLSMINTTLGLLQPNMETPLLAIVRIIFLLTAGFIIMSQVLAKRYSGYRIRIVPTRWGNRVPDNQTGQSTTESPTAAYRPEEDRP